MKSCGLMINVEKSRTLAFQGQGKEKRQVVVNSAKFQVGGRDLVASKRSGKWKYLRIEYTEDGRLKCVCDVRDQLGRLDRAPLKPQQKLFALPTCLIPRLFHQISLSLVLSGRLKKMDSEMRAMARKWCKLPPDTPVAYFHGGISDGALGLPSLRWFGPMLRYKRLDRIATDNNILDIYLDEEKQKAQELTKYPSSRRHTSRECGRSGYRRKWTE